MRHMSWLSCWRHVIKSTCGVRWLVLTHHTLPSRSTSAGRCSTRTGLIHQSTQSTCARWCHNLDLHGGRRQSGQFLGHPLTDACKHCGTSAKHDVGIEIFPDVHVALHDGLEGGVVNTRRFLTDEAWLEEHLRAAEALTSDCDDVSIRQFVSLLLIRAL